MKVHDIMTSPVHVLSPEMTVKTAIERLSESGVNGAPVVDGSRRLLGIITEADLLTVEVASEPTQRLWTQTPPRSGVMVRDVMHTDVFAVSPEMDVPSLAKLMLDRHLKTVPVVEDALVVGVVTRRDILAILVRSDQELQRDVQELLDEEIIALGRFKARVTDGIVYLAGRADPRTAKIVEKLARQIPGVIGVDTTGVVHVRRREMAPLT